MISWYNITDKFYKSYIFKIQMNRFNIKDIENLSGIKAHTWRIWEQRYNIAIPQRKDSNHRFYDTENLKQILRISYLYHQGIKVSKIAGFSADEVTRLALEHSRGQENEYYIKELLEASLDFDEDRFTYNFNNALEAYGLDDTIVKVIYPYQNRIGVLWLTDHVIPAQEHFTSNLIRQKLLIAIDSLPDIAPNQSKQIALFTPEDEQHEIPLLFIHYLLKKNGNKVIYFGRNVALKTLKVYSENKALTHVMFHLVTNLTSKSADGYLHELAALFPFKNIIMSGTQAQAINHKLKNVRLLNSMDEIVLFTNQFYSGAFK